MTMPGRLSNQAPHIMIVEGRFYEKISDDLIAGAIAAAGQACATYERFTVPGALEIPPAILLGSKKKTAPGFDAYVALGCVIRGETSHYETVCNESARGLMDLGVHEGLLIGNGILTCETMEQAMVRADPKNGDKGGDAVRAVLALLGVKRILKGAGP